MRPKVTDIENNFKDYIFYDFEVFNRDVFVIFKKYDGELLGDFHNEQIADNIETIKGYVKNNILVGYNNYGYDDHILHEICNAGDRLREKNEDHTFGFIEDCKARNDEIIFQGLRLRPKDEIVSLDCMQQMNVGLKKIEANIGRNIKETDVSFDKEDELSEDECKLVRKYCSTDVDATIDVFKLRWKSYFEPKLKIIDLLDENTRDRAIKWNTTTITANILTKKQINRWANIKLTDTKSQKINEKETEKFLNDFGIQSVINLWKNGNGKGKKTINRFDVNFDFGFGGLHGVPADNKKVYKNVKLLDVASMYPNILININGLGSSTEIYKEIVEERVRVKESDPTLSTALKLIINSTYGLLKNKYSKIYNPEAATSVCIYGQIALYTLCKELHDKGYEIVNVNTDGVAFVDHDNKGEWKEVKEEWEKEFKLNLELDEFKTWIQKDVNNYIATDKNGKLKVKGKDVKHLYDMTDFTGDLLGVNPGDSWNNTNSLQIVTKGLIHYLQTGNKNYHRVINENLDKPIMFQMVLQAGKTFNGIIDENGNRDYQKVNRVFACVDSYENKHTLQKERQDGGKTSFADAPINMLVYNDSLEGLVLDRETLDYDFYIEKIERVVDRWK